MTQSGTSRNQLPELKYPPKYIAKCLSKKRLGGVCALNLCGHGETLLPREMTGIINALLKEGHGVFVITNGTINERFNEIIKLPRWRLKRLFFKFSFHYLELLRLNLMDDFLENIRKIKKAGCSYSIEMTPYDELIPHIDEIKHFCMDNFGALCHVTVARDTTREELPILTNLSREDYGKTWGVFDSNLFSYKLSVFNVKQTKFCYGGELTSTLNLESGDLRQCYQGELIQNLYENPSAVIKWRPIGKNCPESHCYNAHAFLTFGAIPELNNITPTYADMRNRVCRDGSEWLMPTVKTIMEQKVIKGR
ncbi:hypothetical protein AGMMS50293_26190 [Spirochaetia bacterium]|nr:hypothetical protein AGMMS50293_26190 [Spirochaetia bacterium]